MRHGSIFKLFERSKIGGVAMLLLSPKGEEGDASTEGAPGTETVSACTPATLSRPVAGIAIAPQLGDGGTADEEPLLHRSTSPSRRQVVGEGYGLMYTSREIRWNMYMLRFVPIYP